MKKLKKICGVFLSLIMCITCLSTNVSHGAELNETESNNTYEEADFISTGDTISGTIENESDVDYYKLNISVRGYIEVNFRHDITDSNGEWGIHIYRLTDTYDQIYYNTVGASKLSVDFPKIGVDSGTYYVRIERNGNSKPYGVKYYLTVNHTSTDYWETEINNAYTSANDIELDSTYGGFIENGGDIDYYKINILNKGYIYIDFSHDMPADVSKPGWIIRVYRQTDVIEQIYTLTVGATEVNAVSPNIGVDAGTYYICVDDDNYTYMGPHSSSYGVQYLFSVNYSENLYWETEPNNAYASANNITLNDFYNGFIENGDDIDYYRVDIPDGGYIKINFKHEVTKNSDPGWILRLYKLSGTLNEIYNMKIDYDTMETNTDRISVDAGTYYICVDDDNYTYMGPHSSSYGIHYSIFAEYSDAPVLYGDVYEDGEVDSNDVIFLMRYLAGWNVEINVDLADMDQNGDLDSNDAIMLLRMLAGWEV